MKHIGKITREFAKFVIEQGELSPIWPFAKDSFETTTLRHLMYWLTQGNDADIEAFNEKELQFLSEFAGESQLKPGSFVYRSIEKEWPQGAADFPLPVGSLGFTSWTSDPIVSKNKLMQGDKTLLRTQLPESNWLDTSLVIQKLQKFLPTREDWVNVFALPFPHSEEKEVMIFEPVIADVISPLKV